MGHETKRDVILRTVHGSHLYGLNHAGSDLDTYTVVAGSQRARQRVNKEEGADDVVMGLPQFLQRIQSGSHQAIEAAFSPVAEVSPEWKAFFEGLRITSPEAHHAYERTIRKFVFFGDAKRRRHGIRLATNLRDLRGQGRFNPRMSAEDRHVADKFSVDEASTAAAVRMICGLDVYEVGYKIEYYI